MVERSVVGSDIVVVVSEVLGVWMHEQTVLTNEAAWLVRLAKAGFVLVRGERFRRLAAFVVAGPRLAYSKTDITRLCVLSGMSYIPTTHW